MKKFLMLSLMIAGLAVALIGQAKTGFVQGGGSLGTVFVSTNATTTAVTYTASTIVGPQVLVRKIEFWPNSIPGTAQTSVQIWDMAATGLTYTASSRLIGTLYGILPGVGTAPMVIDLKKSNAANIDVYNATDNGVKFAGYPAVVVAGANSCNARFDYDLLPKNTVIP